MGFIYTLTSPSGKLYNGQTNRNIHERFDEHQKPNSGCPVIAGAIKKYGWENFITDYYECPDEDLDKHERWMIRVTGSLAPTGYNLTEGGSNGRRSEITKQRMSEAHTGKVGYWYGKTRNETTKQKISKTLTGRVLTEDHKKKIGGSHIGMTHTEESKKKISESSSGEKNHNAKKVYQYDMDGKYIGWFDSCEEAARHLEKSDGSDISKCARGKRKTAYKFRWSYEKKDCL
ncbi:hypothetical protein PBCV1_A651L [Paramecium bursaria Chlorella virus 1]|uniref:GIY-YIG domain-containing protein n=2 Tax=Chlorovirus TaxID=181083 RepID=O41133_PBCV1|nr:hypothetical protein PBCV1_A651L [Paramecium bursaria Chlorella virus 1]AAC96973.1 hypothetical protein [Paramecium bursaria Chlorella virus 1]AGE54051.1 GIY-YIG catalytic domain-containing endonuclease [Paramecium bursaria Chlorella virus IL3A]AGE55481.1 GIY-YIG catalytic domain-containing endonuclease [Paramecium bursaria Chlorella virus MA1E]